MLEKSDSIGTIEIIACCTGISTLQSVYPDRSHIDKEIVIICFLYQVVIVIEITGTVIVSIGCGGHLYILAGGFINKQFQFINLFRSE